MASLAERIAAAKAAQGVVQAAPTVAAALAPPPPPTPATAPAPAVPAPRRETAPREHHRREAAPPPPPPPPPPPAPAQDERVRQIAARDIFDSRKAGPIEPKLGRPTWSPSPALPGSLRARYAGSDLDAMVDATTAEKSLLTPADRAAALAQRQGMLDAMQRVAELQQRRKGGVPSVQTLLREGAFSEATGRELPPPAGQDIYETHTPFRGLAPAGTPMPTSALQSVAAFRDEVRKRGDAYRQMSQGAVGLERKAMELEAQSPRLPGVPVPPTLAAVDRVRREYQQKLAKLRADLAEAGLTDEQIDEQGR